MAASTRIKYEMLKCVLNMFSFGPPRSSYFI